MRNRIIAGVVLVLLVVLLVSLVTCIGRAVSGGDAESEATASASAQAASQAAQASQAASSGQSASSGESSEPAGYNVPAPTVPADRGVEDPWVEGGRFSSGDSELDQMVKEFCDSRADSSKSAADNAYDAYVAEVTAEYVESDDNQHPLGSDWDVVYAKQFFSKGTGNCYEFAAAAEYILRYYGYYDAQAVPALVLLESGGYGDHGLVYVTDFDGRKCLCDSSFGANGWMLDAGSYTVRVLDVGQDPSSFAAVDYEALETAPWLAERSNADNYGDESGDGSGEEAAYDEESGEPAYEEEYASEEDGAYYDESETYEESEV